VLGKFIDHPPVVVAAGIMPRRFACCRRRRSAFDGCRAVFEILDLAGDRGSGWTPSAITWSTSRYLVADLRQFTVEMAVIDARGVGRLTGRNHAHDRVTDHFRRSRRVDDRR
jgi:hypothetical protein